MRSAVYFADWDPRSSTNVLLCGGVGVGSLDCKLHSNVGRRDAAESGETRAFYHERSVLVVLQQRRREYSRRDRALRSVSRRAIPVVGLDLQSQPCRERQLDRWVYAFHISSERFACWTLCRFGFRLRLGWLS